MILKIPNYKNLGLKKEGKMRWQFLCKWFLLLHRSMLSKISWNKKHSTYLKIQINELKGYTQIHKGGYWWECILSSDDG